MTRFPRGAALASALLAFAPALAHVGIDPAAAPAGTTQTIALRIGHGCDGSPTVAVRVLIPQGVHSVKPMPKPGWQIALKTAPLAAPVSSHGRTINEGVAEIAWTGGRLDDAHFDEFVLRAALPETPGAVLAFKIVQECESGTHRWIDVAAPGQPEPKEPAPQLRLTPRP